MKDSHDDLGVRPGDTVSVIYTSYFDDGTPFESSGQEPIRFRAGGKEVVRGVSQGVIGMRERESRRIVVEPREAFGERRIDLLKTVPRGMLPADSHVGDQLTAKIGEKLIPVRLVELKTEQAVIDANHPLAGKTLHYEIEVVAIAHPEAAREGEGPTS